MYTRLKVLPDLLPDGVVVALLLEPVRERFYRCSRGRGEGEVGGLVFPGSGLPRALVGH